MLRLCVSRITSSPLSGHLLVHTKSFVFCSFAGVSRLRIRFSILVMLWPLPSPTEISHPKELALEGGQLPQVHSALVRDFKFFGFVERLSFTMLCVLKLYVFSLLPGVLSFSVRLSQRHVRVSPPMAGTLERVP